MLDTTSDAEIKRGKRFPKSVDAIAAVYLSPADQIAVSFVNRIEMRFPCLLLEGLENATDVELSDIEIDAGRLLVWTKSWTARTRTRLSPTTSPTGWTDSRLLAAL